MPQNTTIAVIIPCFNEQGTILQVIDEVHSAIPSAKIYVFDNNSTDNSALLVKDRITQTIKTYNANSSIFDEKSGLRSHEQEDKTWCLSPKRVASLPDLSQKDAEFAPYLHLYKATIQGKGAVIAQAFALIEADMFVMIDADLQHDAGILPRAIAHFMDNKLDMLNISRTPTDGAIHRKGHKFGNHAFSLVATMLFGKSVEDLLSGYRIFSCAFVKSFPATSKGFEIETELSIFALQCGMRIDEISAPCGARVDGSKSKLRTFRDGFKILAMIVQLLFTERPLFVFGIASSLCFAIALILGVPLVVEFIETSKVPRFPTAFICVGFGVIGVVLGIAGLLAHLINRGIRENRRFTYLANKGK